MAQILIIDDDIYVADTLSTLIVRLNHVPTTALTMSDGLRLAQETDFDLIMLDVSLPDGNGIKIIPQLTTLPHRPEVIIITGFGDTNGASLAISNGAWDYLVKGDSLHNIRLSLERALRFRAARKQQPAAISLKREEIIGESPATLKLLDFIAKAATGSADIRLTGATGTGKELTARTIHANSPRQKKDFIVVDCAALPRNLSESILFGSLRGSYTGADRNRMGLVAKADGGTLFFDEIGELSLDQQRVLLRVLQEKSYRPIGASKEIKSDFRLIAATNRNLEAMVKNGSFRRDLFYRFNALNYTLPTLQERSEDIELLALYFIKKNCLNSGSEAKGFSPDFIETLKSHNWPGNIRELSQTIAAAITLAGEEAVIYSQHLDKHLRINLTHQKLLTEGRSEVEANQKHNCDATTFPTLAQFRKSKELEYFTQLKNRYRHDFKAALKASGLSRSRFYNLMKENNLSFD